jgi:putative FmdB family regulatory protein
MPIYEYECEQCGVRFERLQRMADDALTTCPECTGHIHRVMQPVGVIFKGSGFYVTDNRGKSSTGIPKAKKDGESTSTTASSENKSDTASTGTESKGKTESKSATD